MLDSRRRSCWLHPHHPDPEGKQLRHVVDTLKKQAEEWPAYAKYPDMGVFWDWGSIYQKDPALFDARETPEAKPEAERAAFEQALKDKTAFYGGEAYEQSRSAEQKAAFGRALTQTMDVWYAHQMIITIFVTKMPEGFEGRTYEDRGWTVCAGLHLWKRGLPPSHCVLSSLVTYRAVL